MTADINLRPHLYGDIAQPNESRVTPARILPIVATVLSVATASHADQTLSLKALQEIGQVEADIDRIETATLGRLPNPPDNRVQQIELLGKSMLYDKQLSVNRNEACEPGPPDRSPS